MDINTFTINFDKKYFPLPLCVEWLDSNKWKLSSPFEYHRDNGEIIIAPKDFITDFGSKPALTWLWVGSPTDEAGPSYIIHDFLCEQKDYPISRTDYIFYEAMKVLGVSYWKRMTMYFAVRLAHGFR